MSFFTRLLDQRVQQVRKWDEMAHPRDENGKFTDSGGGTAGPDSFFGERPTPKGNPQFDAVDPKKEMEADLDDRTNEDMGSKPKNWGVNQKRSISEVARDIRRNWKGVNYAAAPYLDAMGSLDGINDNYMADSGKSVVSYFLGNASGFKGDKAKELKAELNAMLKDKPIKPKVPRAPKGHLPYFPDGNPGV